VLELLPGDPMLTNAFRREQCQRALRRAGLAVAARGATADEALRRATGEGSDGGGGGGGGDWGGGKGGGGRGEGGEDGGGDEALRRATGGATLGEESRTGEDSRPGEAEAKGALQLLINRYG